MAIRLIAVDMDGTLLRDDHASVSPRNLAALQKALARGVQVVPASGRMLTFLPEPVRALPGVRYAITSNGAAVCDLRTGEKPFTHFLPLELAEEILRIVPPEKAMCEVYINGESYTSRAYYEKIPQYGFPPEYRMFLLKKRTVVEDLPQFLREKQPRVEKINLPHQPEPLHSQMWRELEGLGGLALVSSLPNNIEINAAGANKGAALRELCGMLGVPLADVMAIGDSGNDLRMLEAAGFPVAMGNAEDRVKAAARVVTAPYLEDGVALAVERYVLGEAGGV